VIQALPAFNVSCPSCRSEFPVDPEKVPARGIHAICSTCLRVFRVERPEGSGGFDEAETDELEISGVVETVEDLEGVEVLDHVGATDSVEVWHEVETPEEVEIWHEVEAPEEVEVAREFEVTDPGADAFPAFPEASPVESPAPPEPVPPPAAAASAPLVPAAPPQPVTPPPPRRPQAIEDLTSLAQEAIAEGTGEIGKAQLAGSSLSLGAERFRKRGPQERAQRLARVLVSDIIAYYPARYRESLARGTLKEDFHDEVRKSWKEYVDQVGEELAESTPYFGEALNEILGQGKQIF
jgi:predicted Zn finger-like uncharacterized protein